MFIKALPIGAIGATPQGAGEGGMSQPYPAAPSARSAASVKMPREVAMRHGRAPTRHEVFNQSPPFADVDLFASDRPLQEAVAANGAGGEAAALVGLRAALGLGRDVRAGAARQRDIRRG